MNSVLVDIADIARSAGREIENVRNSATLGVATKLDESPVTLADRRADDLLRRELTRLAPAGWLSEESADDPARLNCSKVWIVDPLDGTKEFIAGLPEYAVAIALVENGAPQFAVVHNPATGETFSAERGRGAWLEGQRLRVDATGPVLASRSELKTGEFRPFAEAGYELRPVGSIEYKLALIAAGRASVTLSRGPKWEWDVCAGSLLVEEAGGLATDVFGAPLQFNQSFPKTRGVLAGAKGSYDRVLAMIRDIGASSRMDEFSDGGGQRPAK